MIATRISTVASRTSTTSMLHHSAGEAVRPPGRGRSLGPAAHEYQDAPFELAQLQGLHEHPFPRDRRIARFGQLGDVPRQEHHTGCKPWPGLLELVVQLHAAHPRHPQVDEDEI